MSRLLFVLFALVPHAAFAHPGHVEAGWNAGFAHPFLGWDHMMVMIAIGLWAARSRRFWIPLAFVSVMIAGAGAALIGLSAPGVEPVILASTVIVAALALGSPIGAGPALAVVSLFAFFHGFAHGAEMPADGAAGSFIAGFAGASLILHGAGFAAGKAATFACESWRKRWATAK